MRYFLAGWLLLVVLVVSIAGFRGQTTRNRPIEVFPDMDRQLKLQPQHSSSIFPDQRSSRLPVAGTVARSTPHQVAGDQAVFPFEDSPVNTGHMTGTTNWVETNPFEISSQLMARGRERFQIYCAPCHGAVADGNGVTKKFGMGVVANLHDARIVQMTDGEIFHVITNGRNLMGPYASQVDTHDRWAIIAYLRALQLSRLGTVEDVPQPFRASLKK